MLLSTQNFKLLYQTNTTQLGKPVQEKVSGSVPSNMKLFASLLIAKIFFKIVCLVGDIHDWCVICMNREETTYPFTMMLLIIYGINC